MNILIIGAGGREHALAWKIRQSPSCKAMYIAPGNAGTASVGTNLPISVNDFGAIEQAVRDHRIDLVLIGPEEPLVLGLTDYLEARFDAEELIVIGPVKSAAMLEGSKAFAKAFMMEFQIPTAAYRSFALDEQEDAEKFIGLMRLPIVLKADGLAAGKGVIICQSREEAKAELRAMFQGRFGDAGHRVVVEEFLSGREFSVFVLTDGRDYKILPVAKDYKRIGEADSGPNTGGMGAISPVSFVDRAMMEKVESRIIQPTIRGISQRGLKYHGFIFCGLIEVNGEPMVIEYNCRMGDPETEVVMPRLQNDLVELLVATHRHRLGSHTIRESPFYAATVMLVSGGYPGSYEKGKPIDLPDFTHDAMIFHAGTATDARSGLVTAGGRVMAVTSMAGDKNAALAMSYSIIPHIHFEGKNFRGDIGFDVD